MATRPKDPTDPIRRAAGKYAGVDEGTACTQSSFKVGKAAFLFIGEQGGRYKAMFKLKASRSEAEALARRSPDDYQVGSWVTARFSADKPMPKKLWEKWLAESYALSAGAGPKDAGSKKKRASKKAATTKAGTKQEAPAKKTTTRKKAKAKKTTRKKTR